MIEFSINGKTIIYDGVTDMPLLWYLRDEIGLTGTKFGCGIAMCGACTVEVDGRPVRSCVTPLSAVAGKSVSTIEAAENNQTGYALQQAWIKAQVPQCGYCQSGQIMAATALLRNKPSPNDDDINKAMSGNICRCAAYPRIKAAIHLAAEALKHD